MKKFKGAMGIGSSKKKANKHVQFPSDDISVVGSQSNHGSNAMSVDQASQESGGQQVDQEELIHVLTSDEQIILVDERERQAFRILQDRTFHHTRAYDHDFLNCTGMITEFQVIFLAIGWENFWRVNEDGCRQLTIEFLCTLTRTTTMSL